MGVPICERGGGMTKDIELLKELKGQYVEKMVVDSRRTLVNTNKYKSIKMTRPLKNELRDFVKDKELHEYLFQSRVPKSRIGGGIEMNEKLGVLLRVPKLEPLVDNEKDFLQIVLLDRGKLTIHKDELSEELCNAYKCTQEEAKKYPQFRWVSLEEL